MAEIEEGQRGNSSLEKRRVRKAQTLLSARLLNVTWWRCSCGITHERLGERPDAAAQSQDAEHAAWARQPQLQGGWEARVGQTGPSTAPPGQPAAEAGKGSEGPAQGHRQGRLGRGWA